MRRRSEKIVKGRVEWRKQNQVKKLRILMTAVAVTLCISIAAGAVLAWLQVKSAAAKARETLAAVAAPASSGSDSLPVYDDSFNLTLVNASHPLPSGYSVELGTCGGVPVDARIVPALTRMMDAARSAGAPLKLAAGYVPVAKQDEAYQAAVKQLMKTRGMSQVLAENQAQATVGRGRYSENQTGLAVTFSAEGGKSGENFGATAQYRWLAQNCVQYGFILRYPADESNPAGVNPKTGNSFNPSHFRYVGCDNAVKMRELSMCLEEYIDYLSSRGG